MELPNLGTPEPILGNGEWGWDKGLIYDPGFARFKLNQKGLLAEGNIDPLNAQYQAFLSPGNSHFKLNGMVDPLKLQYEAMVHQNGNYGIKGAMPLLKGLLSLEADRNNDMNNYRLQYERKF
jgi:hypothetical protein